MSEIKSDSCSSILRARNRLFSNRNVLFLDEEHSMVGFNRFSRFGKPFFLCAASAFLGSKLLDEQQNSREHLQTTIRQAELLCQAFKEKHGIPGMAQYTRGSLFSYFEIIGVSIGVTQHGSMVWKQGFGMADIEQRVPCTSETVMRIASISKTFTITIAGQLVEQGKLSWDDPIAKHRSDLPEFLYEKTPVSITVRQLASHTR